MKRDDDNLTYSSGSAEIDAAVRYWLDRLPSPTPLQRANLTALFNRPRVRPDKSA